MEINKKIEKLIIYIVEIIFILILSFLTIESIFKTCTINDYEITSYLYDNPIIHIITISLTILIFMFINKKKLQINKKWLWVLIGIWTLISAVWIYICDLYPRADQKYIYEIAMQMKQGIFKGFDIGNYAYSNPHQYGLILYEYIFGFIFGSKNYLGLQLINVVALLVSFFCIYKITRILFENKETSVITIFGLLLFIPIWFYITFIYGNILGLAFSMISLLLMLNYLDTRKVKFLIFGAISISLAIVFKSNYLIMLIAIICMLLIDIIANKKFKNIITIILLILMYLVIKNLIPITMHIITGKEKAEGIPMIAYVEMGMQESERAPGWYNTYNRSVYKKNKYNSKEAKKVIKQDLKETINKFKNNPKYTMEFFYKKTISQWNNPNFQCFWISKARRTGTGKEKSVITKSVNGSGKVNKVINEYMNIMQTIILFGATAFMIINFKNNNGRQLIFAIMFIGGFLFHLIWEAKCQYTITYFVLLIPYTVRGYIQLANIINKKLKNRLN